MRSSLLSISDLTVKFGGLTALSHLDIALHPGEVVGLIGPNGAGKTTLFNAITGLAPIDQGQLFLADKEHAWPKSHQLVDLGIARTLQGVGLFPDLTVLENVMVGGQKFAKGSVIRAAIGLDRANEKFLQEKAAIALEKVYASSLAHKRADSLPYPVTKRVAIARALMSDPKILLLDEPAGGLGTQDIDWMNGLIHNVKTDTSILLVEHHMDVVMNVCDRIYVLNFGELIAEGTPAEVRENPAVIAAYLGAEAVK
ncbi:MAG: ABC transporter ATP-binding protein [Actinomycetes bacterium]